MPTTPIRLNVSADFKAVVYLVAAFCAAFLLVCIYLSSLPQPTAMNTRLFDLMLNFLSAGFGAILALIGGKVSQ